MYGAFIESWTVFVRELDCVCEGGSLRQGPLNRLAELFWNIFAKKEHEWRFQCIYKKVAVGFPNELEWEHVAKSENEYISSEKLLYIFYKFGCIWVGWLLLNDIVL